MINFDLAYNSKNNHYGPQVFIAQQNQQPPYD